MKRSINLLIVLLLPLIAACSASNLPAESSPRTQYESLDLGSPEAAVESLSQEFQRKDFPAVFLILSPDAQIAFEQYLNLLAYNRLINAASAEAARGILADTFIFDVSKAEHAPGNITYLFDTLMFAADQHSALLIDLTEPLTILSSSPAEPIDPIFGDPLPAARVQTSVEGIDGEVVFTVVQLPSGRWRVQQVLTEGGDPDMIPWAAP